MVLGYYPQPRLHCPNGCLWNMGMHCSSRFQMIAVVAPEWSGAGVMSKKLVPITFTCVTWNLLYITIISISSVTIKAWLLLSAKAPEKIQLWCTSYVLYGFSSHILTSPLQLHTSTKSDEHNYWPPRLWKINIKLPVQPSLVSTAKSLTILNPLYYLP